MAVNRVTWKRERRRGKNTGQVSWTHLSGLTGMLATRAGADSESANARLGKRAEESLSLQGKNKLKWRSGYDPGPRKARDEGVRMKDEKT